MTRVIIIGGGVSGLACGQELLERGYDVLILEARSRIGGRLKGEDMILSEEVNDWNSKPSSKIQDDTTINEKNGTNSSTMATTPASKTTTKSFAAASVATSSISSQPIDLGGALIHGIDKNPIHAITSQIGVATHRISDYCLLMDQEGWPFDPKQDEKLSTLFNECLEETFRRASQDRQSEASFGELFDTVYKERGTVSRIDYPLLKWHQANLELPSGAGFHELGYTWNEDEPYGFDGAHVAVESSWKAVMERLADGLDILYRSPVTKVQIILPDGSTPPTLSEEEAPASIATTKMEEEAKTTRPEATSAATNESIPIAVSSSTIGENSAQPQQAQAVTEASSSTQASRGESQQQTPQHPTRTSGRSSRQSSNKFSISKSRVKRKPAGPTRFSRRIRGDDTHVRRSTRSTKGVIQMLQIGHENSTSYDDPSKVRKRRRQSNKRQRQSEDTNGNGIDGDALDKIEEEVQPLPSSTVHVTLQNGTVLEADAVVCTIPLGVLKIPSNQPGHIRFRPPLPAAKQKAIDTLGCGLLNKCAMSFSKVFWQDSDFLGLASPIHSYLVLNAMNYTNKPILVFMYGGSFARDLESWTDAEIVYDCLTVLKKICGKDVPTPIDYCITRWGQEKYSKMAFTYIPPGVNGTKQLMAMSEPIYDPFMATTTETKTKTRTKTTKMPADTSSTRTDKSPLIMFAGEHTTPYHPSTIHGAFLSGIREAYRLDLFLSPALNDYMTFEANENVYQHTFTIRGPSRKSAKASPHHITKSTPLASASFKSQQRRRRGAGIMTLRKDPKTILESPTNVTAKKASGVASPLTPDNGGGSVMKSRRSKRSLSAKKVLLEEPESNDEEDGIAIEEKKRMMINLLEDRTLLRSLDSYGRDVDLLRSKILPVYGSTRKRSVDKIRSRWQQLLKRKKPNDIWKSWEAKVVVTSPAATTTNGKNAKSPLDGYDANRRRSGRVVKRKLPVDV